MDRISQTMPPALPTSATLNLFVCCTCLLDTFQPCLILLLSLFPSPPSLFPGLPRLDKSDAKFRDIFLKDTGTRKERGESRQNGLSNPCLSSFIYLCEKHEAVTEIPFSLLSLPVAAMTVFCRPPIKSQWPHSCPGRPHLNGQHIQITSFSSVGLCITKLRARRGSNRISLPF